MNRRARRVRVPGGAALIAVPAYRFWACSAPIVPGAFANLQPIRPARRREDHP